MMLTDRKFGLQVSCTAKLVALTVMLLWSNPTVAETQRQATKAHSKTDPAQGVANQADSPSTSPPKQPINGKSANIGTSETVAKHDAHVRIVARKAKRIRLARRVQRISVVDAKIADVVPVSSREMVIVGRGIGSTTIHLWLDGEREREQTVVTLLVDVQSE